MLTRTGNGFIVEGALTLHPGKSEALVEVAGDFFDDLVRERFVGPEAKKQFDDHPLHMDRVRITFERIEE